MSFLTNKTIRRKACLATVMLIGLLMTSCRTVDVQTPQSTPTIPGVTGTPVAQTAQPGGQTAEPATPQPTQTPGATPVPTPDQDMLDRFKEYLAENKDFIGYVSIADTKLAYPVVQYTDDVRYVYYNFSGERSNEGAIFLGIDAKMPDDAKSMVLHGHNMKETSSYGKMFGYLHSYNSNKNRGGTGALDHYKQHPLVQFDTLYGQGVYKIFATLYIDVREPENRKDPLFFYLFNDFESDGQFMEYVTEIQRRSLIQTTVDVNETDQLLLLSTCDTSGLYTGTGGETLGHFVVVCRKVREGESAEVDVGGAAINPNPLMDSLWYEKGYGKTAPEFEDRDMSAPWFRTK